MVRLGINKSGSKECEILFHSGEIELLKGLKIKENKSVIISELLK